MSPSLPLEPCPAYLVRRTWIVFVIGGEWPYSSWFVGCCLHDLSNISRSILVLLPSSFFSIRLLIPQVVNPYNFHMTDSLLIVFHAFVSHVLMSVSDDETLLPRLVNLSTSFRELPFCVEMSPVWLKHVYSVLCALIWRPMPAAARSRVSAWAGVFARSTISSA